MKNEIEELARIYADVHEFMVCDPTVLSVMRKYEARSEIGMATYGVSLHDNNKDIFFWLKSAQEEAMDLSLYLERIIDELERMKCPKKN